MTTIPIKFYGDRIAPGVVGPRQVAQVPASKAASPPIQVNRWCRNGKHPNAEAASALNEATNQAILYRTKEYFSACGRFGITGPTSSGGVGDRSRWRFAFHTGPYMHAGMALAIMNPPSAGFSINSKARLDIENQAGAVLFSQTFEYGASPTGTSSTAGWPYLQVIQKYVDGLAADTDYFGQWYDVDQGRLGGAVYFECPSMTENFNGYLAQNLSALSSIVDVIPEKQDTAFYNLWRRAGAKLLNWTADIQSVPQTIVSATFTNVIDQSSTTYGATIPGFTFDMSKKARLSQPGVPVKVWVYMKNSAAGVGSVMFRNAAGTASAVVSFTGLAGVAGWYSGTVNMPAVADKWYLMMSSNGVGTLSVYAVSVYEYE